MNKKFFYQLIGILILLISWILLSFFAGHFFIPYPWDILGNIIIMLGSASTWQQTGITLLRVLSGFLLAFFAGTIIGITAGRVKAFEEISKPALFFLQAMPPLLWVIPIILILGINGFSPVLVILLIVTPIVAINIIEGTKNLPSGLSEMVNVYAPGLFPGLMEVILPHLKPFFIASIKTGILTGLKASVVAEYFGANNGIGFQIQAAFQAVMMKRLFSWSLILIILLITISALFDLAIKCFKYIQKRKELKIKDDLKSNREIVLFPKKDFLSLIISKINFAYKKNSPLILQEINLTVNPGEIAVISGDSGNGKTTLLHLLASLLDGKSGQIAKPPKTVIQFQDNRLLPWRTTLYNVCFPLLYSGIDRKTAFRTAARFLEQAGLTDYLFHYPEQLSGGMKRRALFVQCFINNPDLILLDEPFTGLHNEARQYLWELFLKFWKNHPCPVVIVTHYPEELGENTFLNFYELTGKPALLNKIQTKNK